MPLAFIPVLVVEVAMIYVLWRVGFIGLADAMKRFTYRLAHGPQPRLKSAPTRPATALWRLEHQTLDPRPVHEWGHGVGCDACLDQYRTRIHQLEQLTRFKFTPTDQIEALRVELALDIDCLGVSCAAG